MTSAKKQKAVVLIDKNSLDFFVSTSGSVYKMAFQETYFSNLEILNPSACLAAVNTFFATNKISPATIIIVLSEQVLFSKVYPEPQALLEKPQQGQPLQAQGVIDQQAEIQRFLDYVPFENVLSKSMKLSTGTMLVATNADLVDTFKKAFESLGSQVELVIPALILTQDIHIASGLSSEAAKALIDKQIAYKPYNMLSQQVLTLQNTSKQQLTHGKGRIRLLAMIGVFLVLLIVLAVLFFNMLSENQRMRDRSQSHIELLTYIQL